MKNLYLILAISLFFSCANDEEKSEDEKTAENLWQEIQGYSSWNQAVDWTGIKESLDALCLGQFVSNPPTQAFSRMNP